MTTHSAPPETSRLLAEVADWLGHPVPPEWQNALHQVPRHLFLPDRIWLRDGTGGYTPCDRSVSLDRSSSPDRSASPDRWWHAAYSDIPLITALHMEEDGYQQPLSSASAPGTVLGMLEAAHLADGHTVLEIGTGTGYHAALLSARLGPENVTSIEVDAALAETARANLTAAGHTPTVVTGDGAHGHPPAAPYDRIISTCSVRAVPAAWLAQTRPGARIITPWSSAWISYGTLALTRHDDGSASGPFAPYGAYMTMRGQRPDVELERDLLRLGQRPDRATSSLSPWQVAGENYDAQFAIGLRAPDVWHSWDTETDQAHARLWLADDDATSWAAIDYDGQQLDTFAVQQHGPRHLWNEIEAAHNDWVRAGRPDVHQHRLTITPDGHGNVRHTVRAQAATANSQRPAS
ncbi:methyltransferase domain-containing protein [Streptomyces olivaceiscleroticus]|uniref:Protein-L-isoaspartate O-methyltransferase n=1 Tax=Streptomyces olivaceiscleroticus TaxID=68245 RepID=A0ABP3JYR2_9ACTN